MKRSSFERRISHPAEGTSVTRQKEYSTRDIPWEEQKRLGGDFAAVGKGSWPVRGILQEKGPPRSKQYLIDWEPHPQTNEEFEPVWEPEQNVSDHLIRVWHQSKSKQDSSEVEQKETAPRRRKKQRVIQDSSATTADGLGEQSDGAPSPPSLLSDSSASALEIPETQYSPSQLKIRLPPLPDDKSEYETLGSGQPSPSTLLDSPERLAISSALAEQTTPTRSSNSLPPALGHRRRHISRRQSSSPRQRFASSSPRPAAPGRNPRSKLRQTLNDTSSAAGSGLRTERDLPHSLEQRPPRHDKSAASSQSADNRPSSKPKITLHHRRSPFQDSIQSVSTRRPGVTPASSQGKLNNRPAGSVVTLSNQRFLSSSPQRTKLKLHVNLPASSPLSSAFGPPLDNMSGSNLEANGRQQPENHATSLLVHSMTAEEISPSSRQLFGQADPDGMDTSPAPIPLTIQPSIEHEPSAEPGDLPESKANSSQESLNNTQEVETVDGITIPVRPIFGPNEYAIDLPAEGKVKSAYDEIIKIKKKAITRFISRKGAPGTSDISSKKTQERNEMQELLQRLNDTVTHTDLGLPMQQTQYALNESENAAYAEYAGSKFVMLGCLIDRLKSTNVKSIALFAQEGMLQDLLEEYLKMKRVNLHRHDRNGINGTAHDPNSLDIDLLATLSSKPSVLSQQPSFIIAFDASFTVSDPQIQSLHDQFGDDLPIIHFLVTNSSEHVERCVPEWLTSNIRLKVVVRTTYLAAPYLGGDIIHVPDEADENIDGRPMNILDLQRAVRKSPDRRMGLIADIIVNLAANNNFAGGWSLGEMPELRLAPYESPPKVSRAASRTPQPRTATTQTPISRATTPAGRKRLLEPDGENGAKRPRLTPVQDPLPGSQSSGAEQDELHEARQHILQLTNTLATVRQALSVAEENQAAAERTAQEWRDTHAGLLHRYEKNKAERKNMHKHNKALESTIESLKERNTKYQTENDGLKQQISGLKVELADARAALKAEGGPLAALEEAREEAHNATTKLVSLEKSLTSTKADFEFTRVQYQEASRQATDLALEVKTLEEEVDRLKLAADDSKRSLKAMNYEASITRAMEKAAQFKIEVKGREALIKKLMEENAALKSRRGVQTRGSSVQPASSPGPRSRQASPAPGHLAVPPSGSRASMLRNER